MHPQPLTLNTSISRPHGTIEQSQIIHVHETLVEQRDICLEEVECITIFVQSEFLCLRQARHEVIIDLSFFIALTIH